MSQIIQINYNMIKILKVEGSGSIKRVMMKFVEGENKQTIS